MTTPPKRRWFRFGLRTMFVVVTIFGVWLGWQLSIVRERKAVLAEINAGELQPQFESVEGFESHLGHFSTWDLVRVSNVRRWLGDESILRLWLPDAATPELIRRTENAFPEAMLFGQNDAFRDRLVGPVEDRDVNRGTIFKTGLIEK